MTEQTSTSIELHTLLDDGEPRCSCGESFRGLPHHDYVGHALKELRAEVRLQDRAGTLLAERVAALLDVAEAAQRVAGGYTKRYGVVTMNEPMAGLVAALQKLPQIHPEGE